MKKDFDLAAAMRGATVCTAEGQAVRILCYDLKHKLYPIVAAIMDSDGTEWLHRYTIKGTFTGDVDINYDLMMSDDDYLEKLERGDYDLFEDNLEKVGKTDHIGKPTEKVGWDYWRRMYAGMAMQAFITSDPQELTLSHAESAVVAADALIEKLKKQPDPKI